MKRLKILLILLAAIMAMAFTQDPYKGWIRYETQIRPITITKLVTPGITSVKLVVSDGIGGVKLIPNGYNRDSTLIFTRLNRHVVNDLDTVKTNELITDITHANDTLTIIEAGIAHKVKIATDTASIPGLAQFVTDHTATIKGDTGVAGADGKSAYQVAVANGFVGTEAEWLASLVGAKGDKGDTGADGANGTNGADGYTPVKGVDYFDGQDGAPGTNGTNGTNGADGKSAYQVWLDNGHVGTEADFLNSLKAAADSACNISATFNKSTHIFSITDKCGTVGDTIPLSDYIAKSELTPTQLEALGLTTNTTACNSSNFMESPNVSYTSSHTGNLIKGTIATTIVNDSRYCSFPGLTRFQNGTLYVVYRVGSDHISANSTLVSRKSLDNGATWSSETVIYTPATNMDARDPEIVLLKNGTLMLSWFDYNPTTFVPIGLYVAKGTINSDNTVTWGSKISVSNSFTNYSACTSKVIELFNGDLILPIYGRNTGDTKDHSAIVRSTDGGTTWGNQVNVAGTGTGTDEYNEMNGVQLPNGQLVMLIRHDVGSPISYARVTSCDNGATWGSPTNVISSAVTGRPSVLLLDSGGLFLAARTGASEYTGYYTSWDNGATWTTVSYYQTTRADVYNSLVKMPNGNVGAIHTVETGLGNTAKVMFQNYKDGYGAAVDGNATFKSITVTGSAAAGTIPVIDVSGNYVPTPFRTINGQTITGTTDLSIPAETATTIAAINHGTAEKTAIVDADEVTGQNSASSYSLIRTTWASIKAFLKTYFDGIYQPIGSYLTDAPSDGKTRGRNNGAWVEISAGGGISDAPSDGKAYWRKNAAWEEATGGTSTATAEIWTSQTGTYASATTYTFSGTDKEAKLVEMSLFTCTNSTGATRRIGYVKTATNSSGTITCNVVTDTDLASGDKDFKVAYNQKVTNYEYPVRIPGTINADSSNPQGIWVQDVAVNSYLLPIDISVRTAPAGTGASLTTNIYKNTTALFSAAPDLGTNSVLRSQRPTTNTITAGETVSLRIPASAGATNFGADYQCRLYIVPQSIYTAF